MSHEFVLVVYFLLLLWLAFPRVVIGALLIFNQVLQTLRVLQAQLGDRKWRGFLFAKVWFVSIAVAYCINWALLILEIFFNDVGKYVNFY